MRLYLTDRYMLEPLARFLNWTCLWLLHLSERGTQQHALVPEFIVESVVDVTGFVLGLQHTAEGVAALRQEGVLRFLITFMSGPHKVRNPHLKGRFPELLRLWLPSSIGPDSPPPSVEALAASALTSHPLARTRLLPALLELFVDIEYGERQFYEKFNTRYSIALLLQHLWLVPQHRRQFEACSRDKPFMLRFINVLLNDMIYLLDEGLRHVAEVGQNQRALANVQEWNALAVAEQEERREGFARTERIAGSLMALAGAVVHMVWYMTNEEDGGSIEPFVMPEVVDRMGQMVAFFVAQLVGPSVEALRIEHRERVNFHPRTLLTEILSIFLHLAGRDDFLRSVAADQRSFTPELFVSAAALARKRALLSERQLQVLEGRAARLRELANEVKEDDEKLGEIPERFLDPLLSALMRDPVILPHSKQRVERTSIVRHLLNDPCDPFTRQPMTADMLVPDLELKAEIETFIRERRAALAAAAAAPSSSSSSSSASSTSVSSSASAAAPRDPASGPPQ
jgi:ubiquitin conjugation factor E4 B